MTTSPKVIAITLNYNQNDYTLDSIKSVLESNYSNFQLILIENGSSSENYQNLLARAPKDERLIIERLEDNVGYVGGVNHGLEKASHSNPDYYLVMNNDTLMDKKAISALVDCGERHDKQAIVSGKVYNYDGTDTLQYIGNTKDTTGLFDFKAYVKNRREVDNGQYDKEMEMGMLDDIFWIIPSTVIKEIGYYSPYFFLYGEQNDYALRATKKGFKLVYTPEAKLWHKGGITTAGGNKQSPKITYWTTFASLKLAVLHLDEKKSKQFYRKWVFKNTIKRFIALAKGKTGLKNIQAHFKAIKHFNHWKVIKYHDNGFNPF